jgi:hypothetical protein
MLRAVLFGAGWTCAIQPIAFLLFPGFFPQSTDQLWLFGAGFALASALALWMATRLPATPSWPKAIAGWLVGFFIIGVVL